ncbi:MAG: hypothetical protein LBD46_00105 [Endomicrobium sp.]|jgi:hypothetical protein|nr:hypothetical protein [Endomicrobium sp.]
MNLKQLIIFFSVSAVFFLFIIVYSVYAQNNINKSNPARSNAVYTKTSLQPSENYKANYTSDVKPKYTRIAKPAGAPKIVKTETEVEDLLTKN